MTNEQKIRENISTINGLAKYLITYNDSYGEYFTSDSESFDKKEDAIKHEIHWLKEEYKDNQ